MEHHNGQHVLGTTGEHALHEMAPLVSGFYQRLRRMPLGTWAALAEAPIVDEVHGDLRAEGPADSLSDEDEDEIERRGGGTPDTRARARLRRVIDGMPGAAAQIRMRVHGLVSVADGFVHPRAVARMKKVALTAALALLARPHLSDEEFLRLYRPFATAIPFDELAPH